MAAKRKKSDWKSDQLKLMREFLGEIKLLMRPSAPLVFPKALSYRYIVNSGDQAIQFNALHDALDFISALSRSTKFEVVAMRRIPIPPGLSDDTYIANPPEGSL
jgi:hypothetical protein